MAPFRRHKDYVCGTQGTQGNNTYLKIFVTINVSMSSCLFYSPQDCQSEDTQTIARNHTHTHHVHTQSNTVRRHTLSLSHMADVTHQEIPDKHLCEWLRLQ